jgi:hypothetical protein
MASQWYTHTLHTGAWTAVAGSRGAAVRGSWQRGLDMIKILNESSPELHYGPATGELLIDKFAGWGSGDPDTTWSGLSEVFSGSGSSISGWGEFADPDYLTYTIGTAGYSGYALDGSFGVQQLAEAYWVEITGALLKIEE